MPAVVRDIMTTRVVTVHLESTIDTMRRLFASEGFHHLLVASNEKIVGVISDSDLLRHLSPWAGTLGESKSDAATLQKRAHQVMSRRLVSATPETPILEAIHTMLDNVVSCLPVLEEDARCAGIVTWRDVLRWMSERLEADEHDGSGESGGADASDDPAASGGSGEAERDAA